jgi:pimeloyl-ACP methyl ester carboxylesterase
MVHRSSRIKLSAGQMFWRETGDNHCPIVIFLHGSWQDSSQWQQIIEPLSSNLHCFAIDLLGFGNSSAIETPTSIALEVDRLHEFLNILKLRPVYLVGHSLGAWIAVTYALKYPDLVQGVVAISPEGFSLTSLQQYSQSTKWLLAHPWLFKRWIDGLELITSISDGANLLENNKAYWHLYHKFPVTCQLFFKRSIKELRSELVAERLVQFRLPFLVLQGDSTNRSIVAQGQAYAKAVRKSEYRLISVTASQGSDLQIVREIKGFVDRVQTQIDREEVELW